MIYLPLSVVGVGKAVFLDVADVDVDVDLDVDLHLFMDVA